MLVYFNEIAKYVAKSTIFKQNSVPIAICNQNLNCFTSFCSKHWFSFAFRVLTNQSRRSNYNARER